jgi:hypothetical protein
MILNIPKDRRKKRENYNSTYKELESLKKN